jgi:TRAP-type uncharacterized transport system substrate-binding protein
MKKFYIVAILTFATSALFAQEKFTVSGGGGAKNGSTYSQMLGELSGVCSTEELAIVEVNSSGGPANLEALLANKVRAGVIPTDVLLAAKMDNPSSVARIRTLFTMHNEEFHLVVRDGRKTEGGVNIPMFGNVGGKDIVFNSLESLKGRQVGAVGGSFRSLQILNSLMQLSVVPKQLGSSAELVAELGSGKIDAALFVAGQPSRAVESIPKGFRLLPVRMNAEMAKVYGATKITYPNLNGGASVDTISTQALFVTRMFASKPMLDKLAKLRACYQQNVDTLKDKEGTHPKWQDVNPLEQGRWERYAL